MSSKKFNLQGWGETPDTPRPPELEWNFEPPAPQPPYWQFNIWLNYEYARSYRPLVEEVLRLRNETPVPREAHELPPIRKPTLQFALFLFKHFPDFPEKAWIEIDGETRIRALGRWGISEEQSPFDEAVIEPQDLFLLSDRIAIGDVTFNPNDPGDESFAVIKINFQRTDDQICAAFAKWLIKRRRELQAQFKTRQGGHSTAVKPPDQSLRFYANENRSNVGQGENSRKFAPPLKYLAALRLGAHYNSDWDEARDLTKELRPSRKSLYTECNSWVRAECDAIELMQRFELLWMDSFHPRSILQPEHFRKAFHSRHRELLSRKLPFSHFVEAENKKRRLALRENNIAKAKRIVEGLKTLRSKINEFKGTKVLSYAERGKLIAQFA